MDYFAGLDVSVKVLRIHKDNQAGEHYGHWPRRERLSHAETPLELCSGRLRTKGLAKYICATLSLTGECCD